MFGVLVESGAGRQRRAGSAVLSVLAHAGLIAAAVAFTSEKVSGTPAPEIVTARHVEYVPIERPAPVRHEQVPPAGPVIDFTIPEDPIVIAPPVDVPTEIPPIGPARPFDPQRLFVGSAEALARRTGGPAGTTSDQARVFVAEDVERLAVIVTPVRPAYPEALRLAGIAGRVVMRFVVDTSGRVEHGSVQTMHATDPRFEDAVRHVLPRMRFRPALLNDTPVRMLVEMPFEFELRR